MTLSLLVTKLYFPTTHQGLVSRPRLVERLRSGLQSRLTLISAPAGSGKTTLLSEWHTASNMPAAWISLDATDNDLLRFLLYLLAALDTIHNGLGEKIQPMLEGSSQFEAENILTMVINDLSQCLENFILILDDYHVIENRAIHQAILFLLEYMPPCMHLVLLTRSDPPLPLNRLRAGRQLVEIRAAELRFSEDEAALFLNQVMGLDLSGEQVSALEIRTEGWIAGLQLAALALQEPVASQTSFSIKSRQDKDAFIHAFSGSHQYIGDYLAEEVLNRQAKATREFLLKTSILNRLSGSLCDALTGEKDGQVMLESLAQANMFLIPLDGEYCWFRYHHLFADLLRNRLRNLQMDDIPGMHKKAAEWFEGHKLMEDAVQHALEAGDYADAIRLLEPIINQLLEKEHIFQLLSWLRSLPQDVILSNPVVAINFAWGLSFGGYLDEVEVLVQRIEDALIGSAAPDVVERFHQALVKVLPESGFEESGFTREKRLCVSLDVLRASVQRFRDLDRAQALCEHAQSLLPPGDTARLGMINFFLGHIHLLQGNTLQANQILYETYHQTSQPGNNERNLSVVNYLAQQLMLEGKLKEAHSVCVEAVRLAALDTRDVFTGIESIRLADILREWNLFPEAVEAFERGMQLARQSGDFIFQRDGYIVQSRLAQTLGNYEQALGALDQAERIAGGTETSWGITPIYSLRARLHLLLGDLPAVERWVIKAHLNPMGRLHFVQEHNLITLAGVYYSTGRLDDSIALLERLLAFAESAKRTGRVIEILLLLALSLDAQGKPEKAHGCLINALQLAAPEGWLRIFLDQNAAMAALLSRVKVPASLAVYHVSLLAACGKGGITQGYKPGGEGQAPSQQNPLSQRELELLSLIAAGRSNKEIASELFITVGTVKRHTVNIFTKLDVKNRTEAVARARQSGLL